MTTHQRESLPASPVALAALVLLVAGGCPSSTGREEPPVEKPRLEVAVRVETPEPAALEPDPESRPLGDASPAGFADPPQSFEPEDKAPLEAAPPVADGSHQAPTTEAPRAAEFKPNPLRDGTPPDDRLADRAGLGEGVPRLGKNREPFDPIRANGRYFVDWPAPKLALLVTGRQDGYLEPCGCAGKERMKGGLMRRQTLFEDLRSHRGWPTVGIDVGGLVKDVGRQAELKFSTTVEAMRMMKYDAAALGTSDLKLRADQLFAVVAETEALPSMFVSANVGIFGFAHGMSARERVIERGGLRVGITSVLGKKAQAEINSGDVELIDPEAALAELIPSLQQRCDLMILLAHATVEESESLARKFPSLDLVVTAGGPAEPPLNPAVVDGTDTMLVEVGTKSMAAVVLGIYGGRGTEIRYQRVIIDSRYSDAPQVKALMAAYEDQLRQEGLEGLGIHPAPHPPTEILGRFVGSAKCESCHEPSYEVWKKSGHSDAWDTLVNLDPPRDFNPECIACHVIGWNPTLYFPYEHGFLSEAETPQLVDVGCESCHGPGEAHINAELGSDKELQEKLRQAAVITKEESEKRQCMTCHDLDNSPDFDFETYWPLIEHEED